MIVCDVSQGFDSMIHCFAVDIVFTLMAAASVFVFVGIGLFVYTIVDETQRWLRGRKR